MPRTSSSGHRRFIGVLCGVSALLATAVIAPTAAHAAPVDVATVVPANTPAVAGNSGDSAQVVVNVVNQDTTTASGPVSVVFSAAGSTITNLYTSSGSCDLATATCTAPAGIPVGASIYLGASLQLGANGTVTVTAAMAGDSNPANDAVALPITVTQPAAAVVTVLAPAKAVPIGNPAGLRVTLTDSAGAPLPFSTVTIQRQDAGAAAFTAVDEIRTDAAGIASWLGQPTATATYKAVYTPLPGLFVGAAESAPVVVRVMFVVKATISPVAVPPHSSAVLTISVRAGVAGTPVTIQQRVGKGPWRSIAHPVLRAGGRAQVRITTLRTVGTSTFRVIRGADATHEQGFGDAATVVTVTGKGSPKSWGPTIGTPARPGRWNPCAPIDYYINPRSMPANGVADVNEALRRISMASGLTFRYRGRQNITPSGNGTPLPSGILIAWATPRETGGLLHPSAGGVGSYRWRGRQIMSGSVVVNITSIRAGRQLAGFGEGQTQGLVLMHEVGHLVGLAHVNDRWSIMHPSAALPAAVWGAGDLVGLRAVGRTAGCL